MQLGNLVRNIRICGVLGASLLQMTLLLESTAISFDRDLCGQFIAPVRINYMTVSLITKYLFLECTLLNEGFNQFNVVSNGTYWLIIIYATG